MSDDPKAGSSETEDSAPKPESVDGADTPLSSTAGTESSPAGGEDSEDDEEGSGEVPIEQDPSHNPPPEFERYRGG